MLKVKNLQARVDGHDILKGVSFHVRAGEVHAIMGPNGSGKSTLSYVLAGRKDYEVTDGEILFNNVNILDLEPDERAILGIFLSFQYPLEIPGVSTMNFLKTAVNAVRKGRGEPEMDAVEFLKKLRQVAKDLDIKEDMLKRSLNVGFSGGEKKRNEILQMAMLEPKLAILDETDSGLDIDALRTVAEGVNRLRAPTRGFVVITHYQRLLDYVQPDYVHILSDGKIIRTGDRTLAQELEKVGYEGLGAQAA